jgi:hypothetical protein
VSGSRLPPGIAALKYIKEQDGTKEASVRGSRIVITGRERHPRGSRDIQKSGKLATRYGFKPD